MASNRRRVVPILAVTLLGTAPPPAIDSQTALSIEALAARDLRVATVAYRLQTHALSLCSHHVGLPGLIVPMRR